MIEGITLQLIFRFVAAIVVLWFASVAIRRERIFWPFMPLVLYAISLSFTASAEFYQIFSTDLETLFDALFLIFYIWLFFVVTKVIRNQL